MDQHGYQVKIIHLSPILMLRCRATEQIRERNWLGPSLLWLIRPTTRYAMLHNGLPSIERRCCGQFHLRWNSIIGSVTAKLISDEEISSILAQFCCEGEDTPKEEYLIDVNYIKKARKPPNDLQIRYSKSQYLIQ
ncbi:uncharacterized protein LOC126718699 [Quercus robur]|uniref:uncharacterized protein LOC126718699 n=1 Tax=Quercus robur TaxID=38942 RepID=UPI002162506F|nr:uncharacterized protein LOC126718699 [Quercus robur]